MSAVESTTPLMLPDEGLVDVDSLADQCRSSGCAAWGSLENLQTAGAEDAGNCLLDLVCENSGELEPASAPSNDAAESLPADSLVDPALGDSIIASVEELLVVQNDVESCGNPSYPEGAPEQHHRSTVRRPSAPEEYHLNKSGPAHIHSAPPGSHRSADPFPTASRSQSRGSPEESSGWKARAPPQSDGDFRGRTALKEALRRAFSSVDDSLEHRWARDFLLSASSHAVADLFTNQAALRSARSEEFLGTFIDPAGHSGGVFDFVNESENMFVPAFTAGHLTVGISVHRSSSSNESNKSSTSVNLESSDCSDRRLLPVTRPRGPHMYRIGRFVRDNRNHSVLLVIRTKQAAPGHPASVMLLHMRPLSVKKFERTFFICHLGQFNKGHILDSVHWYITSVESRFCPFCHAPPAVTCCVENLCVGSVDPLEARAYFGRDRAEFLGTATAMAVVSLGPPKASSQLRPERKQYMSATLASRSRLADYSFSDFRHRELAGMMQLFAVQLSISDRSPTQTVMPGLDVTAKALGWPGSDEKSHEFADACLPSVNPFVHAPEPIDSNNVCLEVGDSDHRLSSELDVGTAQEEHHPAKRCTFPDSDTILNRLVDDQVSFGLSEQQMDEQGVNVSTVEENGSGGVCATKFDREMKRKLKIGGQQPERTPEKRKNWHR